MILNELKIHQIRNIDTLQINFHPQFTFIMGPNGSGKTSILEALYLLSCARSFRSREHTSILRHGQVQLNVFGRFSDDQCISVQKSQYQTQIKLNNQFCKRTSELALALPTQVFYSELFQIIDAGSALRRSLLDWGLFHVKQNYLSLWKTYKKVLKHRNALLKTKAVYQEFLPWDQQLSDLALQLDTARAEYFERWQGVFTEVLEQLSNTPCTLHYSKGWDKKNSGLSLAETLFQSFTADQQRQYTQYGPHQADILIESTEWMAKSVLSRGQQKMVLFALKLSQANLLDKPCLYLIDDLAAELDEDHQERLIHYLANRPGQYVITNLTASPLNSLDSERWISHYLG